MNSLMPESLSSQELSTSIHNGPWSKIRKLQVQGSSPYLRRRASPATGGVAAAVTPTQTVAAGPLAINQRSRPVSHRSLLAACVLVGVAACGAGAQQAVPTSSATTAATATTTTTPTTVAPDVPFDASANDVLTALNMQLPILHEGAHPLSTSVRPGGAFGGRVSPDVEIYVLPQTSALSKVRAVTVHVTGSGSGSGSGGAFQTPARLLSGVGTSLYGLSADAADGFRTDALPKLSSITQTRTALTVKKFYELTVVVRNSSSLAFVFTPIGVTSSASYESLGK